MPRVATALTCSVPMTGIFGIGFVERVGRRVGVVVALHVARRESELAHVVAAQRRDGDQPRTVCSGGNRFMAVRMQEPAFGGGLAFLVAHRPHENARMVAVAPHQVFELAQAFGIRRHHARLVESPACPARRRRPAVRAWAGCARCAGVAAHLLQLANAVILHRVGQRRTHAGVVLVVAGSLELDRTCRSGRIPSPHRTSQVRMPNVVS